MDVYGARVCVCVHYYYHVLGVREHRPSGDLIEILRFQTAQLLHHVIIFSSSPEESKT